MYELQSNPEFPHHTVALRHPPLATAHRLRTDKHGGPTMPRYNDPVAHALSGLDAGRIVTRPRRRRTTADEYAHGAWGPVGGAKAAGEHGSWGHSGWQDAGWTPATRRAPKNYRRTDQRILDDICLVLAMRPDVDVTDVSVSVRDGEVMLDGTVPYRAMKHAIEDAAAACSGVVEVHNHLKVAAP